MACFFCALDYQGNYKYQACDQKDDTADQAEGIMVFYAGYNKKNGAYDEKNPAPEFEFQVSFGTIICHRIRFYRGSTNASMRPPQTSPPLVPISSVRSISSSSGVLVVKMQRRAALRI